MTTTNDTTSTATLELNARAIHLLSFLADVEPDGLDGDASVEVKALLAANLIEERPDALDGEDALPLTITGWRWLAAHQAKLIAHLRETGKTFAEEGALYRQEAEKLRSESGLVEHEMARLRRLVARWCPAGDAVAVR